MSTEKSSSGFVQIAIAFITLAGSLGGAWIATGAKFESELNVNKESISALRQQVDQLNGTIKPTIESLAKKQDEANRKVSELSDLLKAASDKNAELQQNLTELKAQLAEAGNKAQELKNANQTAQQQITEYRRINPEILKKMQLQRNND
jgi:septal ring factor EnvC (AmiA/AmiB activator)